MKGSGIAYALIVALAGCAAEPPPSPPSVIDSTAEPSNGNSGTVEPTLIAFPVVNGVTYYVELMGTFNRPGRKAFVSGQQHPELVGNEGLARAAARQACTDDQGVYDDSVAGREGAEGNWYFDGVCT